MPKYSLHYLTIQTLQALSLILENSQRLAGNPLVREVLASRILPWFWMEVIDLAGPIETEYRSKWTKIS
jgi:hypothetical protein